MTTDLDARGRDATVALRTLIASNVDEDALDAAYELTTGRREREVPVQEPPFPRRRSLLIAIAAVAATLALLVLVISLKERNATPSLPAPGPSTTSNLPETTTFTTTPDATTSLSTIGPNFTEFLPYPPDAVGLADGRVVFLASRGADAPADVLVLDPSTGEVTVAGHLLAPRANPAMLVLRDGRVLIAGGDYEGNTLGDVSTGEVFDLSKGTSSSAGVMVAPRWSPRAGQLADGRVLVVGTLASPPNIPPTAAAELYDPVTNSFSATGSRTSTRAVTDVFPLDDGRLLVFGKQPEIYDPGTGSFEATPGSTISTLDAAVLLADGTVLAMDGHCGEVHQLDADLVSEGHAPVRSERFDPVTGTFSPGPSVPHCVQTATLLPSGKVLVTGFWYAHPRDSDGGFQDQEVQVAWSGILDPVSGTTQITPNPNRHSPRAIAVADGKVLLVGGVPLAGDSMPWADVYP